MPDEEKTKSLKQELREILRVLIISLIIVIPIRFFVAQPFIVRGASMEPNFHDGQYLVIDELSYRFEKPERGDVVVFRYPVDPSQFFIKRIVGLPGETITIKSGEVRVHAVPGDEGALLTEPYLDRGIVTHADLEVTLSGDEYFVLGDNRTSSSDSRIWGALEREYVIGRAFLRLWPISELSFL